jgi:hypothetical protein
VGLAVVEVELLGFVVLAGDQHVEISVAVEVGNRDVLVVVDLLRDVVGGVGEMGRAVVEEERVGLPLLGEDEIDVAVAVEIRRAGLHRLVARRGGRQGVGDVVEQGWMSVITKIEGVLSTKA